MDTILKISEVASGQASRAGIRAGDLWVSYDGRPIHSSRMLDEAVSSAVENGKREVTAVLKRDGQDISVLLGPERLGIQCIEVVSPSSFAQEPFSSESRYGVAKAMVTLMSIVGWIIVALGGITLLFSFAAPFGFVAGLGVIVSGLLLVMGAQVTQATVDTADSTREMLRLLQKGRDFP